MDPVVHFEMPFEDKKRLSGFYKSAFGWKMQDMGAEMENYILASTTETGPQGIPVNPGTINGGFFPKKPEWPAQYPSVVIGTGDIKKTILKITKAGGKVLGEPMEIPGIGKYVSFMDTEGNRVSVLQPAPMEMPAKKKPLSKTAKAAKAAKSTKTTKKKAAVKKKRK